MTCTAGRFNEKAVVARKLNAVLTKSVAYVLKTFPRLSETFIANEILALEALGMRIHIISLNRPDSRIFHPEINSVRAQVYYLPQSFWSELARMLMAQAYFLRRYPGRWIRAFIVMFFRFNPKAVKRWLQSGRVAQLLEGTDIGHIHAHFSNAPTTVAMMTGILLGLRFSITCHAKDVYAGGRLYSPGFFRNLTRANFVVCVSAKTKQDIVDAWPDLSPSKIHVIYNGLDLERFHRRSAEPRERLILAVGRLVEKKGFPYLLEACQLLRDRSVPFNCEIVGYGQMRDNIVDLVSALNLDDRVRLIGPLDQEELVAHYRRADVFCLPTIIARNDDRDILPNVVKEAMAIGVPVVTTSIPAMEELVEHERSGLLVPPGNSPALAEALERMLGDGEMRGHLADAARQIIEERFNRRKNVLQLLRLLERCLLS